MSSSYTKQELNELPLKIYDEYIEKKANCIGFQIFLAAMHNEKKIKFDEWFKMCKKCEIKHLDSILPIVKGKEEQAIHQIYEKVKTMFPDCETKLKILTEEEYELDYEGKDLNLYERKYHLYVNWKE